MLVLVVSVRTKLYCNCSLEGIISVVCFIARGQMGIKRLFGCGFAKKNKSSNLGDNEKYSQAICHAFIV